MASPTGLNNPTNRIGSAPTYPVGQNAVSGQPVRVQPLSIQSTINSPEENPTDCANAAFSCCYSCVKSIMLRIFEGCVYLFTMLRDVIYERSPSAAPLPRNNEIIPTSTSSAPTNPIPTPSTASLPRNNQIIPPPSTIPPRNQTPISSATPLPSNERQHAPETVELLTGSKNQFTLNHYGQGGTSCSCMAGTALIRMLKAQIRQPADIDAVLNQGLITYRTLVEQLRTESREQGHTLVRFDIDSFLGWRGQAERAFQEDLIQAGEPIQVRLSKDANSCYLAGLMALVDRNQGKSIGAMILAEGYFYALSIHPRQAGGYEVFFFDSHGSAVLAPKTGAPAYMVRTKNLEHAAEVLQLRKDFKALSEEQDEDDNLVVFYPLQLRNNTPVTIENLRFTNASQLWATGQTPSVSASTPVKMTQSSSRPSLPLARGIPFNPPAKQTSRTATPGTRTYRETVIINPGTPQEVRNQRQITRIVTQPGHTYTQIGREPGAYYQDGTPLSSGDFEILSRQMGQVRQNLAQADQNLNQIGRTLSQTFNTPQVQAAPFSIWDERIGGPRVVYLPED